MGESPYCWRREVLCAMRDKAVHEGGNKREIVQQILEGKVGKLMLTKRQGVHQAMKKLMEEDGWRGRWKLLMHGGGQDRVV